MHITIALALIALASPAWGRAPVVGDVVDVGMAAQCLRKPATDCVMYYGILVPPEDNTGYYPDGCERIDPDTARIIDLWVPTKKLHVFGGWDIMNSGWFDSCDDEPKRGK